MQPLLEAKLKAEDYEAAIVMGFYTVTKRVMESTENYGIKQSLYDKIENTPSAKKAGELIATKILKDYPQLKNKKAEVFGRAKSNLTDFWKSYGGTDTTPKTDIKLNSQKVAWRSYHCRHAIILHSNQQTLYPPDQQPPHSSVTPCQYSMAPRPAVPLTVSK